MTVADTITDTAKLEAAEDRLERAITELHRITAVAELNAGRDDDRSSIVIDLELVIDELTDALDCLQLGLGRPYVWLLGR
jgi:hypothetical protein